MGERCSLEMHTLVGYPWTINNERTHLSRVRMKAVAIRIATMFSIQRLERDPKTRVSLLVESFERGSLFRDAE